MAECSCRSVNAHSASSFCCPTQVNLTTPGSVQLLIRSDGNLAAIDCRGRLAAQRDSVAADDVDAHEWVPCLTRRRFRRDPTDALFAGQSQSILDNLVAIVEAQPSMELLGWELRL